MDRLALYCSLTLELRLTLSCYTFLLRFSKYRFFSIIEKLESSCFMVVILASFDSIVILES